MKNFGTRGYSGYRGRRPDGKRWLALILALILLAAAAFLFAQRYKIYHDDGSAHYELPWSRRGGEQTGQELQIVVEEPQTAGNGG